MAKFTDVNGVVANGPHAIFKLKEVLKLAGWVVNQSSDGTTYNASGDQIAAYTDLDKTNAWFEIQEPEVNGRSWIWQRVNSEDAWYVKISAAAGFSGGTPGITQVPSATDEFLIFGTGTDAAPTGAAMFPAANTYRFHIIAESTPVGPAGNLVYGFVAFSTEVGTGDHYTTVFQDPMQVGTYIPLSGTRLAPTGGDADPVIYGCAGGAYTLGWHASTISWGRAVATAGAQVPRGWWDYGGGGQILVEWSGDEGSFNNITTMNHQSMGTGQHGFDMGLPILVARSTYVAVTNTGVKGYTTMIKVRGAEKNYPSTLSLGSNSHMHISEMIVPWEDGTPGEL